MQVDKETTEACDQILRSFVEEKEFLQMADGRWYYKSIAQGVISARILRLIADWLDEKNGKEL